METQAAGRTGQGLIRPASQTATVQIKLLSLVPADFVDDLMTRVAGENRFREAMLRAQGLYQEALAAAWSPFANIGVTVDAVMVDPYRRG